MSTADLFKRFFFPGGNERQNRRFLARAVRGECQLVWRAFWRTVFVRFFLFFAPIVESQISFICFPPSFGVVKRKLIFTLRDASVWNLQDVTRSSGVSGTFDTWGFTCTASLGIRRWWCFLFSFELGPRRRNKFTRYFITTRVFDDLGSALESSNRAVENIILMIQNDRL